MKTFLENISIPVFYRDFFEKETLHIERGNLMKYQSFLTAEQVWNYLDREDLSIHKVELEAGGKTIARNEYAKSHSVDPVYNPTDLSREKVMDYYQKGASIILHSPGYLFSSLQNLIEILSARFSSNFGATVVINSSIGEVSVENSGSSYFILQISGERNWAIQDRNSANTQKDVKKLVAGDLLYIPKGADYEVAGGNDSIHVILEFHLSTWMDVFKIGIERMKENLAFRKSVYTQPEGNGVDHEHFLKLKEYFLEQDKPLFNTNFRAHTKPKTTNWLSDYIGMESIDQDTFFSIKKREKTVVVTPEGDAVFVSFSNKQLEYPAYLKDTLLQLVSMHKDFKLADITDDTVDQDTKIALIYELIEEQLLTIKSPRIS